MIPVLGIPCISQPNLLRECVASIDADVQRLVIIDNSPEGGYTDLVRDAIPSCVAEVIDHRPLSNLGFSGSLNAVIKGFVREPWWMYANADAVFAPGDMARVAEQMEQAEGPFLCGIRDFRLFGINFEMVRDVGFWDEAFVPCYCEDTDYTRRITLSGTARYLMLNGETGHVGSATIRERRYAERNAETYPENRRYYARKWGGDINHEAFTTPFNRGGSLADWTLDAARLRDLAWD